GGAARSALAYRLDGLPGARPGAEPVDTGGAADRRGLRDRGRVLRRGHDVGRGDAAEGPDIRSRPGHGAVSARTVRWHGAAGGDRDGTGVFAVAADPGRADHRA